MKRLFAIALVLMLIAPPLPTVAQSQPDNMGDMLDEIGLDWEGWAGVGYEIDGISFTDPLGFAFVGVMFTDDNEAEAALEQLPELFNRYLARAYEVDDVAFHEVSAGRIGEDRIAQSATIETDELEFSLGYVMAIDDEYLVMGLTFGLLVSPVAVVAPYVEETLERVVDAEPGTWQALRRELPQLSDMPPGYVGDVENDDEPTATSTPQRTPSPTPPPTTEPDVSLRPTRTPTETPTGIPTAAPTSTPTTIPTATATAEPTASPTPTPSPTPIPPRTIHLEGLGDFSNSNQVLAAGTYQLRLSCNAPGAFVEIRWGSGDQVIELQTSTFERQPGQGTLSGPFTLSTDTSGILATVHCGSSWTVDVVELGASFPTPSPVATPTPLPAGSAPLPPVETGYSLRGTGNKTYESATLAQGSYDVTFRCSSGSLRNAEVHWAENGIAQKVVALGYDLASETSFYLAANTYDLKIVIICDGDWTLVIDQP